MSEKSNEMVVWIRTSLEELWSALDRLFDSMSAADWQRPHGAEWVFADLPYHLSYIDRLIVARPVELSEKLPVEQRAMLTTLNELNAWNQSEFSQRPADQPVARSLDLMHSSRDYVRQVLAGLTDGGLENPAWFPMLNMRGFRPALVALGFCVGHTWQHLEEARVRRGHAGTMVSPELTHAMLDGTIPTPAIPLYLNIPASSLFFDAGRASEMNFTFALDITSPGGGRWCFQPSAAGWQVREDDQRQPDLVLSLDLDTYIKMRYFIGNLPDLVHTGEIAVSNRQAYALFKQIQILPDLDFVFPQMP